VKPKFINLKSAAAFIILTLSACSNDPYLYDRTGFDEGTRPVVASNPNALTQTPPDYYRQPQYQQGYQQPAYRQPQPNYQQPAYAQPPYQRPQYPTGGGSRYYSNPYAIAPQQPYQGYSPYYDGDQYYVPPTYYNNVEPSQRSAPGNNSSPINY
jgi:hypothetical protein